MIITQRRILNEVHEAVVAFRNRPVEPRRAEYVALHVAFHWPLGMNFKLRGDVLVLVVCRHGDE